MLDAGCGGGMYVRLAEDAHIVGLDIDPDQLERNDRLTERIVGDVQKHELPPASYDLIICWDVLEHLPDPRAGLENLVRALKPNGRLVLGSPNVLSLKGLVTKATPFWLHQAYYRRISPRHPFRTHLCLWMAPRSIGRWAAQASLATQYGAFYESPMQTRIRRRLRLTGRAWSTFKAVVLRISAGRIDVEATDFMLLMSRSEDSDTAAGRIGRYRKPLLDRC